MPSVDIRLILLCRPRPRSISLRPRLSTVSLTCPSPQAACQTVKLIRHYAVLPRSPPVACPVYMLLSCTRPQPLPHSSPPPPQPSLLSRSCLPSHRSTAAPCWHGVPISGTKRRRLFAFSTTSTHDPNCNRICQEEARRLRTLYAACKLGISCMQTGHIRDWRSHTTAGC